MTQVATPVRRRRDVSFDTYQVGRHYVDYLPNRDVVCTCGRQGCGHVLVVRQFRGGRA